MSLKNKILLIEDEQFLVRFYRAQLNQIGYETIIIEDGKDAIEKINEEMPDLVILDMVLPNKNGFKILQELKDNEPMRNIPIIVHTALSQPADILEIKKLGATSTLVKTETQLSDLIQEVRNFLPLQTQVKSI